MNCQKVSPHVFSLYRKTLLMVAVDFSFAYPNIVSVPLAGSVAHCQVNIIVMKLFAKKFLVQNKFRY